MRLIITLMVLANLLYSKWTFTNADLDNMNDRQREVYMIAKLVGEMYDLGDTLIKISAVETRFGLLQANNGKYCGPMQIAVKYHGITCEAARTNTYLSMMIAAEEIKYWLRVNEGSMEKALISYNGGHSFNPHGKEYLRRINIVGKLLAKNDYGFCY